MPSLVEDLIQVLAREISLYEEAMLLLEQERAALSSRKPQEVLELVRRKETLLLQIRTLEESRRLICVRLAKAWAVSPASLTLTEIRRRSEPAVEERLAEVHEQMRACVERLRVANEANRRLCHQGVEMTRSILHAVSADMDEVNGQAYAKSASREPVGGNGGKSTMHWTA